MGKGRECEGNLDEFVFTYVLHSIQESDWKASNWNVVSLEILIDVHDIGFGHIALGSNLPHIIVYTKLILL